MKKTMFTIAMLTFTAGIMTAQPNFKYSDMPNVGNNASLSIDPGMNITMDLDAETGNGFVWDFSSFTFIPTFIDKDSFRIISPSNSTAYPGATYEHYRVGVTGENLLVFSFDNDTLFLHRVGSTNSGTTFYPKLPSIKFPIAFNEASVVNGFIYSPSGTATYGERNTVVLYDGYGTLKLPGGNVFNDVFRLKKIETDTSYISNTSVTYTTYIWQHKNGGVPLLTMIYTGNPDYYAVFASKEAGESTAIRKQNKEDNISFYPNPSTSSIVIENKSTINIEKIEVLDITGRIALLPQLSSQTKNTIDIKTLPNGVYFMKLQYNKGQVFTKKFIKE